MADHLSQHSWAVFDSLPKNAKEAAWDLPVPMVDDDFEGDRRDLIHDLVYGALRRVQLNALRAWYRKVAPWLT